MTAPRACDDCTAEYTPAADDTGLCPDCIDREPGSVGECPDCGSLSPWRCGCDADAEPAD